MTEEEAKTKWCPAFRGNAHGVNRPNELKTDAGLGFCVGSACMAWQWGAHIDEVRDVVTGERRTIEWTPASKQHGFCGLAGKP